MGGPFETCLDSLCFLRVSPSLLSSFSVEYSVGRVQRLLEDFQACNAPRQHTHCHTHTLVITSSAFETLHFLYGLRVLPRSLLQAVRRQQREVPVWEVGTLLTTSHLFLLLSLTFFSVEFLKPLWRDAFNSGDKTEICLARLSFTYGPRRQ